MYFLDSMGKIQKLKNVLYIKALLCVIAFSIVIYIFFLSGETTINFGSVPGVLGTDRRNRVETRNQVCGQMEQTDVMMDLFNRLSNVQYQCSTQGIKLTGDLPKLYVSEKSKLRYCKTPKAGSTFWVEVFIILDRETDAGRTLGRTRMGLHYIGDKKQRKTNISEITKDDKLIIVTRDPFSRIYSAFIDKIFLPALWSLYRSIAIDKRPICEKSNIFAVFVDFIIRTYAKGHKLDEHWIPITEKCGLCRVPYNFILKQETFHRDVAFVLNNIDMENSVREVLLRGLQEKHVEYTFEEVIGEQLFQYGAVDKNCFSFMDFCSRLWNAFQIQGYISDNVTFPFSTFERLNHSSVHELKEIYLSGVYKYKLTAHEKRQQREQHLRDAYKTISDESLQKIIQIYNNDFRILGYSPVPPHLRIDQR